MPTLEITLNGKMAKKLRRMAREEMVEDPEREIVAAPRSLTTAMNSPNSKRGMYRALKKVSSRFSRGLM